MPNASIEPEAHLRRFDLVKGWFSGASGCSVKLSLWLARRERTRRKRGFGDEDLVAAVKQREMRQEASTLSSLSFFFN